MSRRVQLAVAVGATVAAIVAGGLLAQSLNEGKSKIPAPPPSQATLLIRAQNRIRLRAGMAPFHRDTALDALARIHNRDELRDGFFAHDHPQGPTFQQRLHYLQRKLIGENIAWGTANFALAGGIVSLWMASPGHRANILRPAFRRVGCSVVRGRFMGQDHAAVSTCDYSS